MKILITISLFLLLFVNTTFGQSLFEKAALVDEFGDSLGVVQRNVSIGTFSNSATNNSPLLVHTILDVMPDFKTVDEYKEYITKEYTRMAWSEKNINSVLKYANKSMEMAKNHNGTITFKLYEYKENKASMIGVNIGTISIKTTDGKKIVAKITNFQNGSVVIIGYKKITTGTMGIQNQIKYGYYDWVQSEIYNEIVNSEGEIKVVISFGGSAYHFTLE